MFTLFIINKISWQIIDLMAFKIYIIITRIDYKNIIICKTKTKFRPHQYPNIKKTIINKHIRPIITHTINKQIL